MNNGKLWVQLALEAISILVSWGMGKLAGNNKKK